MANCSCRKLVWGSLRPDPPRAGHPQERTFETKIALGLKMVKRAKAHGVPFDLLACDALYGRDGQFRAALDAEGVLYAAQVPADTNV
jgi:SRSO17 transposase